MVFRNAHATVFDNSLNAAGDNPQIMETHEHLHAASSLSGRRNARSTPAADSSAGLTDSVSNWSSWLLYGELLSVDDFPDVSSLVSATPSQRPDDVKESTVDALLDELEQLAARVKLLPIPRPPTLHIEEFCDVLSLPMDFDVPSLDTEIAGEAHIAYDASVSLTTISAPARITIRDYGNSVEDSGYLSGNSSPVFSEVSHYSDIERTPRSNYRPRAPSPLTPVTPDFSTFTNPLPPMHSQYMDHEPPSAASESFSQYLPAAPHTIPKPAPSTVRCSSPDVQSAPPTKTRFGPIKNLILNRKRSLAAKDLHVPLPPAEPLPRISLDAPRSGTSFLDFKVPRRGLRRRNSEDLLVTSSADTMEYESFLSF